MFVCYSVYETKTEHYSKSDKMKIRSDRFNEYSGCCKLNNILPPKWIVRYGFDWKIYFVCRILIKSNMIFITWTQHHTIIIKSVRHILRFVCMCVNILFCLKVDDEWIKQLTISVLFFCRLLVSFVYWNDRKKWIGDLVNVVCKWIWYAKPGSEV